MEKNIFKSYSRSVLNKLEKEVYFELYNLSSYATPFHNFYFLNIINNVRKDLNLKFYIIKNNEHIIAMMPYFGKEYLNFTMNSLPYGCYGGFLYNNQYKKLIHSFLNKHKFSKFITSINSYSDNIYDNLGYLKSKVFSTWIINCDTSFSVFFDDLHSKTRNQIRRSHKYNVEVKEVETEEELQEVFKIYEDLIKKHSISKPYSILLFKELFNYSKLDKFIKFKIAKIDNIVISYSVFLIHNTQVFYWLNASHSMHLKYNGTNAILANMVEYTYSENIKELNLGAVPLDNSGLQHFKTRWNAVEKEYKVYMSDIYYKLRG